MEKKFSVKEFFKSTAFKCIYVLLAIVLVCGVLLAFCNDLFEVTAEEKLNRVLGNIYPDGNVEEIIFDADHETDLETEFEKGAVDQVYLMDDGNYLIHAYGTGGFGGNVYMWVVVEMSDGAISGIGKTQIDTNDTTGETYLNKIPGAAFDFYSENYADGENFDVQDIKSEGLTGGATMSMTGATNAVNTALEFVRTQLLGEVIVPDEPSPFEKFSYYSETYISDDTTVELADDETSVIFHITTGNIVTGASKVDITVSSEGVITDYTIVSEGTTADDAYLDHINDVTAYVGKKAADILPLLGTEGEDGFTWENADESLVTGATMTNFTYVYAAVFAASNYQNGYVMALENSVQYTQYIDMENTTVEVSGTDVIYHITTKNIVTGASKVDITVNSEGVITGYTIVSEGTTAGDQYLPHVNDVTEYVGKSAADILPLLGTAGEGGFAPETSDSTLHGGATYTNFYYAYAAMFAASNYEVYAELAQYLPPAFTYTDYIDVDNTTWDIADDESSVTFHITTINIITGASKVDITVNSEGVITGYTIVSEGTTAGDQYLPHVNDVTEYVGKSAADILPLLGTEDENGFAPETSDSTLHGGATYTNFYYAYAALFAAENYDLLISGGENA